ncbi:MAG: hypothetical protein HZA01_01365 [Nitrospinae bacterium]|nr:hypothetical protein [Nitrospinota bacterium]
MRALKLPAIFLDFRNIEMAFIFLIALKLCFSGMLLLDYFQAGANASISIPDTPAVYAETKAESADTPASDQSSSPSPAINMEILETMKKRGEELDARSAALDEREKQLNMLQLTIDGKLQKMNDVQKKIEQLLTAREDLIDRSIKHLVKVYSSMKPGEAASLIEKLDEDISIQILSKMKGKSAAKILEKMSTEAGSKLSDKIAKRK